MTDRCDEPLVDRLFTVIGRLGVFRVLLDSRDDLTLNQLRVLFRLHYRRQLTMSDVANALAVSQPTATGVVDRLVERDLVARQTDPQDRRRVVVTLTPLGSEQVRAMRCAGADLAWAALQQLTAEQRLALLNALEPLHDWLTRNRAVENDHQEG